MEKWNDFSFFIDMLHVWTCWTRASMKFKDFKDKIRNDCGID